MNDLIEYRVTWTKLPRNKNDGRVLFVRAESSEAASAIAMDHIERKFGITNFVVDGAKLATATAKPGRTRTLTDLAANVSKLSGVHQIGVRLELVGV